MVEILRTENLSKSYRRRKVVNSVCIEIHEITLDGSTSANPIVIKHTQTVVLP